MGDQPKKLVTWKNWVVLLVTLVGFVALWLYRAHQEAGGIEAKDVIAPLLGVCIVLVVFFFTARHANRPEPKDKP